jgi:type IV secretory pathway VirB10-like protein
MAEDKRGDRRETAADDATVVAPRFDEREAATARPVVPLATTNTARRRGAGGFSLRANSHHLLLAWAVIATLAAGGVAVYKSAYTPEPQVAPQSATENTTDGAVAATPETTRRAVPVAPARAAKMTEARVPLPVSEVPDWSDREDVKRDELDEEELEERARKEEKRRRKEEKRRREEAEEEAEEAREEAEHARKEARKQAERQRERQKDDGRKARLVGVLTRQD